MLPSKHNAGAEASQYVMEQVYAMARSDPDTLLLPLLKLLYEVTQRTSSNMYMLLVIFLLLSQDTAYSAAIHTVPPYLQ